MKVTLTASVPTRNGNNLCLTVSEMNRLIGVRNKDFFTIKNNNLIAWGPCANTEYTKLLGWIFLFMAANGGAVAHTGFPRLGLDDSVLYITDIREFEKFIFSIGSLDNIKIDLNS